MNSFGRLFRISIYGESHGPEVGILIDGLPSGIKLSEEDFKADLLRRKAGGLGTTPRIEPDEAIISSGVFNGYTTGAPLLVRVLNTNTRSKDYSNLVDTPRPGHADYTAKLKYNGYNDYRGGGHFSGRLTLGLVIAGVVAKKITAFSFNTKITSLKGEHDPSKFKEILEDTTNKNDSVGGVVNVRVSNLISSLGEPFFDSCESVISHLMFSVGGVKGVEFGLGFRGESLLGSEFNDSFDSQDGHTATNNNGGINGGITNGNDISINVFVKPTPSVGAIQRTYSFKEKKMTELKIEGRHDVAIILRAQVVLEACAAIALADLYLINKEYQEGNKC